MLSYDQLMRLRIHAKADLIFSQEEQPTDKELVDYWMWLAQKGPRSPWHYIEDLYDGFVGLRGSR